MDEDENGRPDQIAEPGGNVDGDDCPQLLAEDREDEEEDEKRIARSGELTDDFGEAEEPDLIGRPEDDRDDDDDDSRRLEKELDTDDEDEMLMLSPGFALRKGISEHRRDAFWFRFVVISNQ